MPSLEDVLAKGYDFVDDAVIFGRAMDPALEGTLNDQYVQVPLRQLNKHGLIAGATGTGKTKTLQLFAEQLSMQGVPVFLADLKGDLSGLAVPSPGHPKIDERMTGMDLPWNPTAYPVELLSLSGHVGLPLRVPIMEFGPLLLAKVIDASPTQEGVLQVIFRWADENDLALLDLEDLTALLKWLVSKEGKAVQQEIGGLSTQSLNVLLRKMIELEGQGAEQFFGEPAFDVDDLLRTRDGKGVISVMNLTDVQDKPKLFSTFMMWLLAEVYENSPEVGDKDKPRLVFFFDEAHLLFDGASKSLLEAVELTVRMIRSKGVGVFFVTQQPKDVPDDVLAQLGNRVQHALRAFTPQDQKALKATAQTFPISEHYDVREVLTNLGVGEALVTVLGPKGSPTPTAATRLMAPTSMMDPAPEDVVTGIIGSSDLASKYGDEVNRESAAEILGKRLAKRAKAAAPLDLVLDVEGGIVEEVTDPEYVPRASAAVGPGAGFRFTDKGGKGRKVNVYGNTVLQTMEAGQIHFEGDTISFLGSAKTVSFERKKLITVTVASNLMQFHVKGRQSAPILWTRTDKIQRAVLEHWLGVDPSVITERLMASCTIPSMPTPDETVADDVKYAREQAKEAERARREHDKAMRSRSSGRGQSRGRRSASGSVGASVAEDVGASVLKSVGINKRTGRKLLRGILGNFRR